MPFGLKNAPATFQRLMDGILGDLNYAAAYIDDVVMTSDTWENHLENLRIIMDRLTEAGMKLKRQKCAFRKAEVQFLGHQLGGGKVQPQQTKVEAIRNFRKPVTKKDLRTFLGLVGYYRRFIQDFGANSAKLTDATGKLFPDKLEWTRDMEREFETLRGALLEKTSLNTFDPNRETVLHTDALDCGVGGVLVQQTQTGEEVPIAFFSRKLLPREIAYTITEKECLAMVNTVQHFQAYLLGAPFKIVTDHKALLAIPRTTSGEARVIHWALTLQPFDFTILHKPGKTHLDADGLSRQAEDPDDFDPNRDLEHPTHQGLKAGGGDVGAKDLWTALVQVRTT